MPKTRVNFKTIIVASEDDIWVSMDRARSFAECWGSELINVGKAGHVNVASGFGEWAEGVEILKRLG